jgi:hypothetical protein
MWELLNNPLFLVFGFLTITGVVGTLSHAWRKVRQTEIEAQLKSDMVQRGMTAEDIQKVMAAGPSRLRRPECGE